MNHTPAPSEPGGLTATSLITANPVSVLPRQTLSTVSVHPIEFTGSGSEYFRIWIVNLLLLLVTLGLYYPWAKVRKLRYFHGNTLVAGHPLDFHGEPRKMFRGFMLVSIMMVLYSVAGRVSHIGGTIAGLILALLWPALMRASMQFRLANTSWRGLRFAFKGSMKEAYLIWVMPLLLLASSSVLAALVVGATPASARPVGIILAGLLVMLMAAALGPYVWWRLKRYQHNHYALGQWQTTFKASYGDMVKVFVRTALVSVAGLLLATLLIVALLMIGFANVSHDIHNKATWLPRVLQWLPFALLIVVLTQIAQGPYFKSRMQNLIWTQTGNRHVRFKSHLAFWPLLGLTLKNTLLMVLTLGLYWPFATIAMARIKLQAISVHTRQDPDELLAQAQSTYKDAAGDLAADLIGIDVGL